MSIEHGTPKDWQPSPEYERWRGCNFCKHRHWRGEGDMFCDAYVSVPLPIADGTADHMVPRPGQVPGILFEDNGVPEDQFCRWILENFGPGTEGYDDGMG